MSKTDQAVASPAETLAAAEAALLEARGGLRKLLTDREVLEVEIDRAYRRVLHASTALHLARAGALERDP